MILANNHSRSEEMRGKQESEVTNIRKGRKGR